MHLFFYSFLISLFLFPSAGRAQEKKETKPSLQLWGGDTIQTRVPYFKRRFPEKKGQVRITMGFPWINQFYVQTQQEPASNYIGFIGLSFGSEYAYKADRYLRLEASFATTHSEPTLLASDVYDEYLVYAATLAFSYNIQYQRWTFGTGVQYSNNGWRHTFCVPLDRGCTIPSLGENSNTLGAIGTVHYQLGKAFFAGMVYRPNFVRLHPETAFLYQHSVSLDLSMKLGLRNKL